MICQECGKRLTNEEDCYGHDCEVIYMGYYQKQIEKVIHDTNYNGMFKLKIKSDNAETNWMDITPKELIEIRAILKRG